MKAITVRQPWAWAIMHDGKDVENRSRNIAGTYRGPVVIHAGLTDDDDAYRGPVGQRWLAWWANGGSGWGGQRGFALGVVDLIGVHPYADCDRRPFAGFCSNWAGSGAMHLELAHPHAFAEPIPYRGRLGLWEFPDDLLRQADLNGWAT